MCHNSRKHYTKNTLYYQEGVILFLLDDTCTFGVDIPEGPPTPQTPLPVPPPDKKGHHFALFIILHLSAYSSIPETKMPQIYGTKTEIQTPMHT